jgi:hypothetical protein
MLYLKRGRIAPEFPTEHERMPPLGVMVMWGTSPAIGVLRGVSGLMSRAFYLVNARGREEGLRSLLEGLDVVGGADWPPLRKQFRFICVRVGREPRYTDRRQYPTRYASAGFHQNHVYHFSFGLHRKSLAH